MMGNAEYNYLKGFTITPETPATSVDAKAPYIDYGTAPIETSRYFSKEYMAKEWENLWTRIWVMAGVAADVREPGDFFTFKLRHESFVIVRGEDGKVRAFYNVCAHRGLRLVRGEFGYASNALTCPYHNWSYHLNGRLAGITDRETFRPEVICHNPGLTEVHCEMLAGFVFISMNEAPPPLAQFLGVFGEHLQAYQAEKMVVARHVRVELGANWKGGVDGFLEGYHFHSIHAQVLPIVDDYHVQQDMYPGGISRLIIPQVTPSPRLADPDKMTDLLASVLVDSALDPHSFTGRPRDARRLAQQAKRTRAAELGLDYSRFTDGQVTDSYVYAAFPNVILGAHPEAISLHRFLPHEHDVDKLYFDTITLYYPAERADGTYVIPAWMGFPKDTDFSGDMRPEVEIFPLGEPKGIGLVLEQDAEMIPLAHLGQRSRSFKGALLGEQEQRIRHFHAELDKYMV
jgi:carnitine monooxygenase subunit